VKYNNSITEKNWTSESAASSKCAPSRTLSHHPWTVVNWVISLDVVSFTTVCKTVSKTHKTANIYFIASIAVVI